MVTKKAGFKGIMRLHVKSGSTTCLSVRTCSDTLGLMLGV